ncbi:MAG: PD-(D/E)XK nuclease family protein [Terracidiphilus sp.]
MAAVEIDGWLREGGLVVTASDRAARALATAFHRARRAEGLSAWPAPGVLDWKSFSRGEWERRSDDARLLLNPTQERKLWVELAGNEPSLATALERPRHRLAALAMEAHELLCSYAPRFLRTGARAEWQQDAAVFGRWLAAFEEVCRTGDLLSASRLPLELIPLLKADSGSRPPLLLAGFDRILPVQRSLFDAWGQWRETFSGEPTKNPRLYAAADALAEVEACAIWCGRQLAADPKKRLLVVTQDASKRRGEIERAFLRHAGAAFEFSLGVPLSQVALARAAHLMLRWLDGALNEHEVDWLLSTGQAGATAEETAVLQSTMRVLRRRGLERTRWTLAAFISQRLASQSLPAAWVERVTQVQRRLADLARRPQNPLEWAELVPRLLADLHFAEARPLASAEYQALRRWQQAVESCGSLGFDGRRIGWRDSLIDLGRTLDETLFAPESHDAPIQIAGPAESAGLAADAIWFMGVDEDSWPASGSTQPLLPIEVQREAGMPHATPQSDWELARSITTRLLASAYEVHFSYARQKEGAEARPSRLIAQHAGEAQALPRELIAPALLTPTAAWFEDRSRIPFPPGKIEGGAAVLTAQSQCPFKAFATARLGAQDWEPAEAGLTPSQRGSLLHKVLHAIWAGAPDGIRSHAELQGLSDKQAFVAEHVRRVFASELRPHLREVMPRRYLELEELRLTGLLVEWLDYEAARLAFEVTETEAKRTVTIAGLTLDLRLDRIDRLSDESLLVIDYKTGNVSPSLWELPRPDDVQLPLYAGFAIDREKEVLGGLAFAKVRPNKTEFAGRVGDAVGTLSAGLGRMSALVKNPLTAEQLLDWRDCIEQLAGDFVDGRADVNPREYPKTCERCGLQALCRIQEQEPLNSDEDFDGAEGGDE